MMSAAHQSQVFARRFPPDLLPSARTVGRSCPSLRGLPTTLNKPQMATHSKGWGVPLWNCCAFPPAARQGRAYLHAAAGSGNNVVSLDVTLPRYLGRRLSAGGPFRKFAADRSGCRRPVAITFKSLRECGLKESIRG